MLLLFFFLRTKLSIIMVVNIPTRSIPLESEDKSLTLPGNVVESLVSPSCDPKEIVLQLKEIKPTLGPNRFGETHPGNNENDPLFFSNS